jgi:hypothetical protein
MEKMNICAHRWPARDFYIVEMNHTVSPYGRCVMGECTAPSGEMMSVSVTSAQQGANAMVMQYIVPRFLMKIKTLISEICVNMNIS